MISNHGQISDKEKESNPFCFFLLDLLTATFFIDGLIDTDSF